MGRLKKDHFGWSASGKWLKYKQPTLEDEIRKVKSKKDTKRWCLGKTGIEHALIRKFYRTYNDGRDFDYDYYNGKLFEYIECACVTCGKKFHRPNAKDIRLAIPVRLESVKMPIQVKVNGRALPIDHDRYRDWSYWCMFCKKWE